METISRREFFRNSLQKVMPIMAVAVLSSANIMPALATTDCRGCADNCSGDCSGGCTGTCYYSCGNGCGGACASSCQSTCSGSNAVCTF